jgi:hypothetical protein
MKWFCLTCMSYHTSEEEIQRCRLANRRPLTADEIKAALDWVKDHGIIFSKEKA